MASYPDSFTSLVASFDFMKDFTIPKSASQRPYQSPRRLVVFDFDDTLYPTSFFRGTTFSKHLLTSAMLSSVNRLDRQFAQLIAQTSEHVQFVIVTNATESWLHAIMPHWMPQTYAYFGTLLTVLSAPDRNTNKYHLMHNQLLKGKCQNIPMLSVGDGVDEEIATAQIKASCPKQRVYFVRASRKRLTVGEFLIQLSRLYQVTVWFIQKG